MRKTRFFLYSFLFVLSTVTLAGGYSTRSGSTNDDVDVEKALNDREEKDHALDSLNILIFIILLVLTVLSIWFLRRHELNYYVHESGLALIYGVLVGVLIRYAFEGAEITKEPVTLMPNRTINASQPPDLLYLNVPTHENQSINLEYSYKGVANDDSDPRSLEERATFNPELFFNLILPPIIFNAGYGMKRRYFFRNFGSILTFAFLGTLISWIAIAGILYGCVLLMPTLRNADGTSSFGLYDALTFGAINSATDPVTVLAIFNDLRVDVDLYALVFGESVLNDAVAIVLVGAIEQYGAGNANSFEVSNFFSAVGNFVLVFGGSFLIGSVMGCVTALITKFTRVRDYPELETALFFLMSYSTFLIAEAAKMTGIVAVLFCGICQAHYTYHNLSEESKGRTKQVFELLNFLAENFIFSYIGISMFTFRHHSYDAGFIFASLFAIIVSRAVAVFPLSFMLNLGRKRRISWQKQVVMYLSGLRGALAFALSMRNTSTLSRQRSLTATSLIVIITVITCGASIKSILHFLKIPRADEEEDDENENHAVELQPMGDEVNIVFGSSTAIMPVDKSWAAKKWSSIDKSLLKPLLTNSTPPLVQTLPACCFPFAKFLTTAEQLRPPSEPDSPSPPLRRRLSDEGEGSKESQLEESTVSVDEQMIVA